MKISKEIPLKIRFELGRTKKSINELFEMTKNTVYRLEDSELDVTSIYIGEEKVGEGEILVDDGKTYVRIKKLIKKGELT